MTSSNKKFVEAANPHAWMLAADNLHTQAIHLYGQRGKSTLTSIDYRRGTLTARDGINKSVFLLGGFALENAIKAFLVYENPHWISNGVIARPLRSHKLTEMHTQSSLIPSEKEDQDVLRQFEEGLDSWARYPCGLTLEQSACEVTLQPGLWVGYRRLMRAYGASLRKLLAQEWLGPHGFRGRYEVGGQFLDTD